MLMVIAMADMKLLMQKIEEATLVLNSIRRKHEKSTDETKESKRGPAPEADSIDSKKLYISKDIFGMLTKFSRSIEFKELARLKRNIGLDDSRIKIYHGGWGHRYPKYGGYGCWSDVFLTKHGSIEYRWGYKAGPGETLKIKNPKELSTLLNYEYILNLQAHISSGALEAFLISKIEKEIELLRS